jgi:hypothetical protein
MAELVNSGAWAALLGWPLVSAAAAAFWLAVARRSRAAAVTGCVLAAPMLLYLGITPRFGWLALAALGLLCVFAGRVRTAGHWAIAAMLLPAATLVVWVAYAVIAQ